MTMNQITRAYSGVMIGCCSTSSMTSNNGATDDDNFDDLLLGVEAASAAADRTPAMISISRPSSAIYTITDGMHRCTVYSSTLHTEHHARCLNNSDLTSSGIVRCVGVIVIDCVAGEIICLVSSVCVRVCVSVCLWALSCLNRLTLIFGMRVDIDLG